MLDDISGDVLDGVLIGFGRFCAPASLYKSIYIIWRAQMGLAEHGICLPPHLLSSLMHPLCELELWTLGS